MIHQNQKILNTIKGMSPVHALIKSLQSLDLDIITKAGITRIFISLFMNTEKLLSVKKPKTQRALGEDCISNSRPFTFITPDELEDIKAVVNKYFNENTGGEDLCLHYEYLRLLSYLLNSDFLLGPVATKGEWRRKLSESYKLLEKAFRFCVKQLSISVDPLELSLKKRTTTGNIAQIHEETEDAPVITTSKGNITEEQLSEAGNLYDYISPI